MAISILFLTRATARVSAPALALCLLCSCAGDDAPTGGGDAPPGADTTPPARVSDLAVEYLAGTDAAILSWTAPRDNEAVDAYDIRYSYSFPLNWELARRVDDPPEPGAAGDPQSHMIASPLRGSDVFVAIRSMDAAGNVSPTSSIATTRIDGYSLDVTCEHALTGEPVESLDVAITSRHLYELATDGSGRVVLSDLASGTVNVAIRPGGSGIPFHHVNHAFVLGDDESVAYKMIPYQPAAMGVFESVFQVFLAAVDYSATRPIFRTWHSVPVPLYLPEFVNVNGIDYADVSREAVARWEDRTGLDLWEFVTEAPDTGVTVHYPSRDFMGTRIGYTSHENGPDGYPVTDEVFVVDDFNNPVPLRTTMMHELGHTIRFAHLPSGYLMYGGQPLPGDVTDDEVLAARLYHAIPNGIDLKVYDFSAPEEAP